MESKAITANPDLLTKDSSTKVFEVLNMSSGGDFTHDTAETGIVSKSNLVCVFKINSIDTDSRTNKDCHLDFLR